MSYWHVKLRRRSAGWFWECWDPQGKFICSTPLSFRRRWEALKNFERWFEDHWSSVKALRPHNANTDADWVCGL